MKKVSILLVIISLVIASFSLIRSLDKLTVKKSVSTDSDKLYILSELPVQAASDTNESIDLRNEIESIRLSTEATSHNEPSPLMMLWIKLGFSLLFGSAALYVILSQKYNEETQKWAFSVLSLITGVWIGTIS